MAKIMQRFKFIVATVQIQRKDTCMTIARLANSLSVIRLAKLVVLGTVLALVRIPRVTGQRFHDNLDTYWRGVWLVVD